MHVKEHKIIPNVMKRHKLTAKYTQQEKKKKRNRRNKQLSDSEYSGLKKKNTVEMSNRSDNIRLMPVM